MKLTIEGILEMTPEDRTAAFGKLGAQWHGAEHGLNTAFAAATGLTGKTVWNWRHQNNVPPWAILLLVEWTIQKLPAKAMLNSYFETAREMSALAAKMERQAVRAYQKLGEATGDSELDANFAAL